MHSMLHLRNLKATVILADTLTTILMPSDSDSDDGSEAGGGAVETAPAASEVQLLLSGLSASLATFGNGDCQLWRLALALKDLEIRDSVQAIGSSRPRAWRRMLGYHASATVPRDPDTSLLSLVVETAHAQGDGVQHSVSLALLPLRLQLDQHSVAFLQAFGEGLGAGAATCQSPPRSVARTPSPVHIECLEVAPFVLTLDYRPRQIDMAALARCTWLKAQDRAAPVAIVAGSGWLYACSGWCHT